MIVITFQLERFVDSLALVVRRNATKHTEAHDSVSFFSCVALMRGKVWYTMKTILNIRKELETMKARSAWGRGVIAYALDMVDGFEDYLPPSDLDGLKSLLLNGAKDWREYSYGGSSLIYNGDIAKRLCSPSEYKRTGAGLRYPSRHEDWCDVQARALYQAWALITTIAGY